jgi:hypothetical protein
LVLLFLLELLLQLGFLLIRGKHGLRLHLIKTLPSPTIQGVAIESKEKRNCRLNLIPNQIQILRVTGVRGEKKGSPAGRSTVTNVSLDHARQSQWLLKAKVKRLPNPIKHFLSKTQTKLFVPGALRRE